MKRVHILATVRKPELLKAALLVFRTLRVGFPTAQVWVWGNRLPAAAERALAVACTESKCNFHNLGATVHDEWIEELIQEEPEPFFICDTDVVFWERVENWSTPDLFAGRLEPDFFEEFTQSLHVERLHTSVMMINPGPLRAAMRIWMARIPAPMGHQADFPLVRQTFIPKIRRNGDGVETVLCADLVETLFYDTMAGLWQAGLGTAFTDAQDKAFDHLHCATYVDLIGPMLSTNLAETHEAIYADHTLARGMLAHQKRYYEKQQRIICPTK